MTKDEATKLIDKLIREIGEHIPDSAVQVTVSFQEGGATRLINRGTGNWYARQGMAHELIQSDIAQEHAVQIADAIRPEEPPEGEQWKK